MANVTRRFRGLAALVAFTILWGTPAVGDLESNVSTTKRLRENLDRFLKERASSRVNRVEIPNLESFGLEGIASNDVEIELRTRVNGELMGRVPVTVILSSGNSELKRGVVTAELKALANVLVATRSLNRGQVVGDGDFRNERRDVSVFRGAVITRASRLRGMRVRRSINPGQVWQPRHLEVIPTVKRGELVRLRLETGGLRIDGRGKASEDGGVGDWIRVLNSASNRFVTGQVDEEGNVHVRF